MIDPQLQAIELAQLPDRHFWYGGYDKALEDDLADLLCSFVNLFHRKLDRIERELDTNEQAQRRGQNEQDGSEVKSVELERLIAQGLSLIERRNAFEFVRDHAAELYEATTANA